MTDKRVTEDTLHEIFNLTVERIRKQLADDECRSSDVRNALQLLRDNHIEIDPQQKENLLKRLGIKDSELPFQDEETIVN